MVLPRPIPSGEENVLIPQPQRFCTVLPQGCRNLEFTEDVT